MLRENNKSLNGFDLNRFHEMYYAKKDKIDSIRNYEVYLKSLNLMYTKYNGIGNPKLLMNEVVK